MLDGDHKALVDAALPVCARYGLAVAGGYAVKAHGLVQRPSEDIDFATGTAAPTEEIVAALAAAYRTVGFEVRVLDVEGRKEHLLVTLSLGGTYRVDVLKEPLNHPVVWMEFGPVIALCRAALDEDFSLETLRDQLAFAATYPDEAFARYGAGQELIAEVKAWALSWSTEISLDMAESEPWSDDENTRTVGRTCRMTGF
jgi:hypothetical protein